MTLQAAAYGGSSMYGGTGRGAVAAPSAATKVTRPTSIQPGRMAAPVGAPMGGSAGLGRGACLRLLLVCIA